MTLLDFFDKHQGNGVHKCRHYMDIYERHAAKFKEQEVHMLEIGIQSGGGLELWKELLGSNCFLYGVDIDAKCKQFETERIKIFTGDQADKAFWNKFNTTVPKLDIVCDDGGHSQLQQITSFEMLFPKLSPGGIYICEDILLKPGGKNEFVETINKQIASLHETILNKKGPPKQHDDRYLFTKKNKIQKTISSIHIYPLMVVVEKTSEAESSVNELITQTRGTKWI